MSRKRAQRGKSEEKTKTSKTQKAMHRRRAALGGCVQCISGERKKKNGDLRSRGGRRSDQSDRQTATSPDAGPVTPDSDLARGRKRKTRAEWCKMEQERECRLKKTSRRTRSQAPGRYASGRLSRPQDASSSDNHGRNDNCREETDQRHFKRCGPGLHAKQLFNQFQWLRPPPQKA